MQRGKRIVGDLRLRRADGGKERGLACVRQADQPGIRNQLQPQADRAFLAGLPGVGMARGAVGRRLEVRIAEAAITALGDRRTLTYFREIGDERLAVFFVDLSADRHLENDILAVSAGAVLAHAITAALRLEVLLVSVIDQSIETINSFDHHGPAFSAIASVRPAELDEFLAPERHAAFAARAGRYVHLGFIEEFHDLRIYRIAPSFAQVARE